AEALYATRSIPDSQVEQAREQVALARAQMQAAEGDAKLARTGQGQHAIFAPFAGVVTKAPTAGGGVVSPGSPLVHVEDLSRFRLSATVSEDDVALVRIGAPAEVSYRGRSVQGKVIALVPSLDATTRRAPVEIEVPNEAAAQGEQPLLAWAFVRASVRGDREVDALRIPGTARRPGSQDEVVVVTGGKAHLVRVTASQEPDGSWVVRSGLSASDLVLVSPDGDLHEGDAVGPTTES
ncbi:MAG TPA: efflux RND transporter periplasmic adaptor subunit, partial [Acidimicrobiales bacterium]|nr:efflux RND transporter periplasmic adaptor subunit [Acidimicrobiales bacterium]